MRLLALVVRLCRPGKVQRDSVAVLASNVAAQAKALPAAA
jgi:hypothetical protein